MTPALVRQARLVVLATLTVTLLFLHAQSAAQEKAQSLQEGTATPPLSQSPGNPGGGGYRFAVTQDNATVPVVVVGGTPYQMGWHLGRLLQSEIQRFVPAVLDGFKQQMNLTDEVLDQVWAATSAYTDDRVEQEMIGVAQGAELPVRSLHHAQCLPLLMPYSCSSIAAWGEATADGHLYQTRNLDWSLEAGAHEFPVLAVYLPAQGHPHVLPTFAGFSGANCGLNAAGLALSEMGDASKHDMPYDVHAPHFTTWFRTLLYDADSLTDALAIFQRTPQTKKYHFVFGDGRTDRRAVKIRTLTRQQAPADIALWSDNDPKDELAPHILSGIVYQDEGRGAFPHLQKHRGQLNPQRMMEIACQIPIKGGNVLDAVFDATALRLWVSYAGGGKEAYQRPFVHLNLTQLDGDADGQPDLMEGAGDRNGNGKPDFLDPIPQAAP